MVESQPWARTMTSNHSSVLMNASPLKEAITMYTINGAWQDHMDTIKGSIEVGKLADLQVLGADILEVDPHVIGQIPVVMTIVGGKIVYSSANK